MTKIRCLQVDICMVSGHVTFYSKVLDATTYCKPKIKKKLGRSYETRTSALLTEPLAQVQIINPNATTRKFILFTTLTEVIRH